MLSKVILATVAIAMQQAYAQQELDFDLDDEIEMEESDL